MVDYRVCMGAVLEAYHKKQPSTIAEPQTTLQKIWNEVFCIIMRLVMCIKRICYVMLEASGKGCSELSQAFAGLHE